MLRQSSKRKISMMMTYHTFLANVFGLCKFIVSNGPARVWVNAETGVTSVINPEEFFEQAFGDNDLENMILHFSAELNADNAYGPVTSYRDSLLELETFFNANQPIDPRLLLASKEWLNVRSAAEQVVRIPAARTACEQTYGKGL
jgi:hypothetical protein